MLGICFMLVAMSHDFSQTCHLMVQSLLQNEFRINLGVSKSGSGKRNICLFKHDLFQKVGICKYPASFI